MSFNNHHNYNPSNYGLKWKRYITYKFINYFSLTRWVKRIFCVFASSCTKFLPTNPVGISTTNRVINTKHNDREEAKSNKKSTSMIARSVSTNKTVKFTLNMPNSQGRGFNEVLIILISKFLSHIFQSQVFTQLSF